MGRTNTHKHTLTVIYIYIYIYLYNCRASIINSNKHALLDTCALCLYIFVGHLVMVSLDIFFVDIISWGSCSQMEVFPDKYRGSVNQMLSKE